MGLLFKWAQDSHSFFEKIIKTNSLECFELCFTLSKHIEGPRSRRSNENQNQRCKESKQHDNGNWVGNIIVGNLENNANGVNIIGHFKKNGEGKGEAKKKKLPELVQTNEKMQILIVPGALIIVFL